MTLEERVELLEASLNRLSKAVLALLEEWERSRAAQQELLASLEDFKRTMLYLNVQRALHRAP